MKAHKRHNELVYSGRQIQNRVLVGIPLTGLVRAEWMLARYGQTIPVNWSNADYIQFFDTFSPLSYAVADARNVCVQKAVENNFEWLLFIDHDVILPPDTFIKLNGYMRKGDIPVVCGLYNAKGVPPEPLIFRGRGNSYFTKWKPGEKVWVDAVPMGCTLINMKLMKPMWESSPPYNVGNTTVRRVFDTPRKSTWDGNKRRYVYVGGTEDIYWCDRVIDEGWLKKTGFLKYAKMKYPFLCDTSIKCGHIDNSGKVY